MVRHVKISLGVLFLALLPAPSLLAGPFRWQTGQMLTYKVEQVTKALASTGDTSSETETKLLLTKRWKIKSVDRAGVATFEMSLARLRLENTRPDGQKLVFDSDSPEKSDAGMKKELAGYIDKPLATLKIDTRGRVLEINECKFGTASRFENELPFIITMPEKIPQQGDAWDRAFQITLDPPQGTGEKYDAVQSCLCQAVDGPVLTVRVKTVLKNPPEESADQEPLLQFQPQGEVVFDTKLGLVKKAQLKIDKELKDIQGSGSRYRFQSVYSEELVEKPK